MSGNFLKKLKLISKIVSMDQCGFNRFVKNIETKGGDLSWLERSSSSPHHGLNFWGQGNKIPGLSGGCTSGLCAA